ncbi:MAG: aminoglycoside phosphotransferase family protein [Salinisphaeraceae bacterium]|nr:aminoglycoside phosphotransferase family protein [Salinisphaeraceae bacterium]
MTIGSLIGTGRVADVYAWGDHQVLKVFRNGTTLSQIEQEAALGRAIYQAGLPVPKTYQIIKTDGRYGIVFERINGPSMLAEMSAKPWKLFQYARLMAELHVAVHDVVVPGLPSQREQLQRRIQGSGALSIPQKEVALSTLDRLPDNNKLTHGDFHPDNIVMMPDGPIIIDWATASQGNPAEDVARTALLLSSADPPPETSASTRLLIGILRDLFNKIYLRRYFQLRPDAQQEFEAWQLPIVAARLGDGIEQEQAKLLKLVNVLSTKGPDQMKDTAGEFQLVSSIFRAIRSQNTVELKGDRS